MTIWMKVEQLSKKTRSGWRHFFPVSPWEAFPFMMSINIETPAWGSLLLGNIKMPSSGAANWTRFSLVLTL